MNRIAHVRHLMLRFFTSLRPRPVDARDQEWVHSVLAVNEQPLWDMLSAADQRESVDVARTAAQLLAATPFHDQLDFVAAALLHDVGKTPARLGPVRRASATVMPWFLGRERVRSWARPRRARPRGARARIGTYIDHAAVGQELLAAVGARSAAVEWAAAHHEPGRWEELAMPLTVCQVLAAADGEPAR